jgi:hypothetical protein
MSEKKLETAFLVYKDVDGDYTAVTDVLDATDKERQATLQDVKAACFALLDTIRQQEISQKVVEALKALQTPTDTTSSSIREALTDRGIL